MNDRDNFTIGSGTERRHQPHSDPTGVGDVPASLIELMPDSVQDRFRVWLTRVQLHAGIISQDLTEHAQQVILTGAVNDALGLIQQIDQFNGRGAAFTSRAILEHAVNFLDVTKYGSEMGQRFEAHQHVTNEQLSSRRWHLEYFDKKERKRQQNSLDGLAARTRRFFKTGLAEYSNANFKRGWATRNLRERAYDHGLGDHYEGYKILSGVIHGASGGLQGLVFKLHGGSLHRIGPDLSLIPISFQEGLRNFDGFLQGMKAVVTRPEVDEILDINESLLGAMQNVQTVVSNLNKTMTPRDTPPQALIAFVALYKSGQKRWYLHDTRTQLTGLAQTPQDEPDLSHAWSIAETDGSWARGFPSVLAVPHIRILPKENTPWVAHHSIFPHLVTD